MVICCILHNLYCIHNRPARTALCKWHPAHFFLLAICRIPCESGTKTMHVNFLSVYFLCCTETLPSTLVAVMWIWWEFIRMRFIRPLKHGHVVSCRNHLDKSELFLEHFSDIRGCQSFVGSRCDSHGCFMGLTTAGCMAVTKQRVFYQRVIGARQRLDWNCRLLQRPLKYEEMLLNLIPCSMCRDIFWCSNDFKKAV